MSFLEKAKKMLAEENAACVIVNDKDTVVSKERGVLPVLMQFETEQNALNGAYVADKVIGKSAAMLFVYGKVEEVYGGVMSEHAIKVLRKYHIPFSYGQKVPYIVNRKGDGMCPMENAVLNIVEPSEAYYILKEKIKK